MNKTSKLIVLVLSLGIVSITTTGCLPKKVPVQKQRTISTVSMELLTGLKIFMIIFHIT